MAKADIVPRAFVPQALAGAEREMYEVADDLIWALLGWTEELAHGETPEKQFVTVADKLRKCAEEIVHALKINGELYR